MNEGRKSDSGKLAWHLLPYKALEKVVQVLMHGAQKYGENNWQRVQNSETRYFNAAMRHLISHRMGELLDPESGLPHLAHAVCSVLFMLANIEKGTIQLANITDLPEILQAMKWDADPAIALASPDPLPANSRP